MPAKSPIERPVRIITYLSRMENKKLDRISRRKGSPSIAATVRTLILDEHEKLFGPLTLKEDKDPSATDTLPRK